MLAVFFSMNARILAASFVLLLVSACASTPRTAAPPASLHGVESLSWMSGVWIHEDGESRAEEYWTPPLGGMMLGAGRELKHGRTSFFEHLRIEEQGDDLVYVAMPMGKAGVPFRLVSQTESSAAFENPEHDFPRRILYRAEGEDVLVARIEGEGGPPEEWRFRRAR